MTARLRYYVVASLVYMGIGVIVLVRGIMAHALLVAVLGVIFIALGAYRMRTFLQRQRQT